MCEAIIQSSQAEFLAVSWVKSWIKSWIAFNMASIDIGED